MSNDKMELKARKLLYDLKMKMLSRIQQEARNKVEYCSDKADEAQKWMEYISNPAKWDYCGLLSESDQKVMATIEYLLDDEAAEIRPYKEWKPIK